MRDRAHRPRPEGVEPDAACAALLDEAGRIRDAAPLHEREDDDVRLDRCEVELDVVAAQELLRQQARVGVIVGKPFDVVGERVRPRGREDARPGASRRRPCAGTDGLVR